MYDSNGYRDFVISNTPDLGRLNVRHLASICASRHRRSELMSAWDALGHGKAVLKSDLEMDAYLDSYGFCHFVKLAIGLDMVDWDHLKGGVEIYDWGCGQGLGAMVAVDFLQHHGMVGKIGRVVLIDIGEPALHRAVTNLDLKLGGRAEVQGICCDLRSGSCPELAQRREFRRHEASCLHVFSNVLDLSGIDIPGIANFISRGGKGPQAVACVGPINHGWPQMLRLGMMLAPRDRLRQRQEKCLGTFANGKPFTGAAVTFSMQ